MYWEPERDVTIGSQHSRLQPDVEGIASRHSFAEERVPYAALWPEARLKGMPRELAKA